MEYNFRDIEKKWQQYWVETNAYKINNDSSKPKYYVLDMFPYPSGAGLHVGHPLGYIASDIFARYKRLKGYNVLHPMGYDAFGLPAEQYAIEHGVHPAVSTANNIQTFEKQLNNIGFCYDWSRKVNTSDPAYYKWTQWIFLQLFNSWYNRKIGKAEPINTLENIFRQEGNSNHECPGDDSVKFTAKEWLNYSEKEKADILMHYRLSYCGYGEVNWCEALGTVLANDEVVNGVSERGGHPVEKRKLRQWYLRITEYADRLLKGLETVDFSDAMKEMQTNWIGKSSGAEIDFLIPGPSPEEKGDLPQDIYTIEQKLKANNAKLFEFAKTNRKNATEAEDKLWQELRNINHTYKFRRQHPIADFIADFACLEVKLIVEVDGAYHTIEDQIITDSERDKYLAYFGYETIRFTNQQVLDNTEEVIKKIIEKCDALKAKQSPASTTPLSLWRGDGGEILRVYTTRPDTIFGVDFMVIAPEHELVEDITSSSQKEEVEKYIAYVKSRSDRERMAEKRITGCFTGAYAVNPFDKTKKIPIYISEYVLAGYGTGAIMAVPCGDERDHKFARHFNIPITNIIGDYYDGENANPTKDAVLQNSGFLNGMVMRNAIDVVINKLEEMGIGKRKTNYRMRDAAFSRQRYWGEPFPILWRDGIAYPLDEKDLPLELPVVDSYEPGPSGEGPLANMDDWKLQFNQVCGGGSDQMILETNTMPGYAGSSWYFLRYMDPHNEKEFASKQATDYWNQVDLYIGGTEHAVGHLLYSRMWTKFLYDVGKLSFDEPYRRLVNQGMIQGSSRFVYRVRGTEQFVSENLKDNYETDKIHVDVNMVDGVELDMEAFKKWKNGEYANAEFILENGKYICGVEVEKMSKSKFNTVNPDDLVERFGADTFRMYEMFLGPVEQSKPWDTKGIEGVHRFIKKLWRLFYKETTSGGEAIWTDEPPTDNDLKILHKTIQKIESDTERFSFNTAVSAFMVCINELTDAKCTKKAILENVLILLAPYAPHVAEELWHTLGNQTSVLDAAYPVFEEKYIKESSKEYPVSINGKVRTNIPISLEATQQEVQDIVLKNEIVQKWMDGKPMKKLIYVKGKMINVVV